MAMVEAMKQRAERIRNRKATTPKEGRSSEVVGLGQEKMRAVFVTQSVHQAQAKPDSVIIDHRAAPFGMNH